MRLLTLREWQSFTMATDAAVSNDLSPRKLQHGLAGEPATKVRNYVQKLC
jgi:hypothetical protein